jgi:hypothetical protein
MSTIITATECTVYTSITATVGTIISKKLIEIVEARLPIILNNYFISDDIQIQSSVRFNATGRTITLSASTEKWEDYGFLAGDYLFIYGSYRNDKYAEVSSITNNILTLTSSYSVIDEYHNNSEGKVILFARADWPEDVKSVAAEMVYYDYDVRSSTGIGKVKPGIRSRSLGPLSESYTGMDENPFGYPTEIISKLDPYKLCRLD